MISSRTRLVGRTEIRDRLEGYDNESIGWLIGFLTRALDLEYERARGLDQKASWAIASAVGVVAFTTQVNGPKGPWPGLELFLVILAAAFASAAALLCFAGYRASSGWPVTTEETLFRSLENGWRDTAQDLSFRVEILRGLGERATRKTDDKATWLMAGEVCLAAGVALLGAYVVISHLPQGF